MKILSSRTHTIIGAVVGVVLIVAPWLLGFSDVPAARNVAIGVGIFVLLSELTTRSPASPIKVVPMRTHLVVDVVTGIFLAASPWLFGFADDKTNAWLPHLIVGILIVGYALLTQPTDSNREGVDVDGVRSTPGSRAR